MASLAASASKKATPPAEILSRVATRVRAARKRTGLSRRALSKSSGVSERYLAELEAGRGNISISLLDNVAHALDCPIASLIADAPSEADPEMERLLKLFKQATPEDKNAALQALSPTLAKRSLKAARVCLIGLRGAGKSTLGRLAGKALNMPFIELSDEIETHAGLPVREVMALYGPEGYRQLERQALERIKARHSSAILAVAGGIVSEAETYDYLLRNFYTIWLKAAPEEHMNRVRSQGDERPMAGRARAMDELHGLLRRRAALYAEADTSFDTAGKSVETCSPGVISAIKALTER